MKHRQILNKYFTVCIHIWKDIKERKGEEVSVCVPEASMAVCEKPNPDPEGEEGWSQYRAGYPLIYFLIIPAEVTVTLKETSRRAGVGQS